MRITILYDATIQNPLTSFFNQTLLDTFSKDPEVTLYAINQNELKPCMGCFGCWLKTPGKCVITNDLIDQTNDAFVNSDLMIITSPIEYGCYSSSIKRTLDRGIPCILPFFRIHKGEIHHQPRYKKLAPQLIVGYNSEITSEERKTFNNLVKANATNLNISNPPIYICTTENEITNTFSKIKALCANTERSLS